MLFYHLLIHIAFFSFERERETKTKKHMERKSLIQVGGLELLILLTQHPEF